MRLDLFSTRCKQYAVNATSDVHWSVFLVAPQSRLIAAAQPNSRCKSAPPPTLLRVEMTPVVKRHKPDNQAVRSPTAPSYRTAVDCLRCQPLLLKSTGSETSPSSSASSEMPPSSSAGSETPPSLSASSQMSPSLSASSQTLPSSNAGSETSLVVRGATTSNANHDWSDKLPMEVLHMVFSLVPDAELYSLIDANRRLHRITTSILLERKQFRARGRRILILHENAAFTALGLYVR